MLKTFKVLEFLEGKVSQGILNVFDFVLQSLKVH